MQRAAARPLEYHRSAEEPDALSGRRKSAQGLASAESDLLIDLLTARSSASAQTDWTVTDAARDIKWCSTGNFDHQNRSTEALSESLSAPAVPTNLMAACTHAP